MEKGEFRERDNILQACKDCDEELACKEYELVTSSIFLVGMAVAKIVSMYVDKFLDNHF